MSTIKDTLKCALLKRLKLNKSYSVTKAYYCLEYWRELKGATLGQVRTALEELANEGNIVHVIGSKPKAWRKIKEPEDVLYIQHNCPESAR